MESNLIVGIAGEIDSGDPGDDIQRRFRYQAAYAAMLALEILKADSEFEEIFCEHHEDILIRKKEGNFVGTQVKTRELGRDPFKAKDEKIVHAIKRFIEQSIQYPDNYAYFVIATNHSFWSEKRNSQNLKFLLELAQSVSDGLQGEFPKELSKYIALLSGKVDAKMRASCTPGIVLHVLSKIRLEHKLPKFDDVDLALIRQILFCYEAHNAGYDDLLKVARTLINKMLDAASLSHVSPRNSYFALLSDPEGALVDAIIDGKRITQETIQHILNESLSTEALLKTLSPVSTTDLPKTIGVMEFKMAKGKVSFANIQNAKDLKYSAEYLLNRWRYKYGLQLTDERYQQLLVIISNICQEAYDQNYNHNYSFGQKMLQAIRGLIRERYLSEPNSFFGCKYEHLLGIVGILT